MAAVVALHVLLILFIPWTNKWVPALVTAGVDSLDLCLVFWILASSRNSKVAKRQYLKHECALDARSAAMMLFAACAASLSSPRSRNTGKERDAESGNDYFDARYYSSAMGRFMSPDWSAQEQPVPYATLDNPQTLNLYSYMRTILSAVPIQTAIHRMGGRGLEWAGRLR